MTISITQPISGVSSDFVAPRKVGQKASLVEAIIALYFEPTFEPERTTPPGNGMITFGTLRIASMAASTAGECRGLMFCQHKKVAAADGAHHAGGFLAQELAVHHR